MEKVIKKLGITAIIIGIFVIALIAVIGWEQTKSIIQIIWMLTGGFIISVVKGIRAGLH